LIAAVAIPASIISTFTLMRGMDFFSEQHHAFSRLTLAVGIVIDDAHHRSRKIFFDSWKRREEDRVSCFDRGHQGKSDWR